MRQTGTCKWFDKEKGYGFIRCTDGTEIFVHFREIRDAGQVRGGKSREHRQLLEGQKVEFDVVAGKEGKGPRAADVAVLS
jgi:CspA family cold shock protein